MRYGAMLKHEKANEYRAKCRQATLFGASEYLKEAYDDSEAEQVHQEAWSAYDDYCEVAVRVLKIEMNLRRSHVAYCIARKAAEKKNLLHGLEIIETAKGAELSLASPLELLANSLTSHAPPLEPDTKTGTGSS
jgi:hypothetical protein